MSEGNRSPLLNHVKAVGHMLHKYVKDITPLQKDRIQTLTGHRYDLAVYKGIEPLPRGRQPRILTIILIDFISCVELFSLLAQLIPFY